MIRIFIVLLILSISKVGFGQNLVQNPSFEDTIKRTTAVFLSISWVAANKEGWNYFTPFNNNIDLRGGAPKNFVGFQNAKEGNSYIGIQIYFLGYNARSSVREYAQNTLSKALEKDSVYCLRLYMSMADSMIFASKNQLGVYLSANQVSANNRLPLPYTPQIIISPDSFNTDKENWTEYNFQYTATGGERYMTVGNFNDTNSLDTLFVGGGNQFWMESSYYYLDNFYLGNCDSLPLDTPIGLVENVLEKQISVYPNPFENRVIVKSGGNRSLDFILFNLLGKEIDINLTRISKNNYELDLGVLPKGIYYLTVYDGINRASRKIVKQ